MTITIRKAQTNDALAIAKLIELTHGDACDASRIAETINSQDHLTLVSAIDSQVVGVVFGFSTIAQNGTKRAELDLLGVDHEFSGRGLGKKLIRAFTEQSQQWNVALVRALVRADNVPMHHTIGKCGYTCDETICELHVLNCDFHETAPVPESAHLLPVSTLTYSGVWLEGTISKHSIEAAKSHYHTAYDVMGAVIPQDNIAALQVMQHHQSTRIGAYQWWVHRF